MCLAFDGCCRCAWHVMGVVNVLGMWWVLSMCLACDGCCRCVVMGLVNVLGMWWVLSMCSWNHIWTSGPQSTIVESIPYRLDPNVDATGLPNIPKDPRSTVKWVPTCQQIDIPVIKNICNSGMTTTRPPIETTSVLESFPDVPDTCLTHTEGHCSIPLGTTILKHLTHSAGLNWIQMNSGSIITHQDTRCYQENAESHMNIDLDCYFDIWLHGLKQWNMGLTMLSSSLTENQSTETNSNLWAYWGQTHEPLYQNTKMCTWYNFRYSYINPWVLFILG